MNRIQYINGQFQMDHQCDEWVIGNIVDAEDFYEELGSLIEKAKIEPRKDIVGESRDLKN